MTCIEKASFDKFTSACNFACDNMLFCKQLVRLIMTENQCIHSKNLEYFKIYLFFILCARSFSLRLREQKCCLTRSGSIEIFYQKKFVIILTRTPWSELESLLSLWRSLLPVLCLSRFSWSELSPFPHYQKWSLAQQSVSCSFGSCVYCWRRAWTRLSSIDESRSIRWNVSSTLWTLGKVALEADVALRLEASNRALYSTFGSRVFVNLVDAFLSFEHALEALIEKSCRIKAEHSVRVARRKKSWAQMLCKRRSLLWWRRRIED